MANLRSLRTLIVGTFPDDSLELIGSLRSLQYLRILHLPKITDLGPLAKLAELQYLSLETAPGWDSSGKVTEVENLEPIAKLPALRHMELLGVIPKDRSLKVLERCTRLVSARFSKYPASEVEQFYVQIGVSDAHPPNAGAG